MFPNIREAVSTQWRAVQIVLWKNFLVVQRRKSSYVILLIQVFFWFWFEALRVMGSAAYFPIPAEVPTDDSINERTLMYTIPSNVANNPIAITMATSGEDAPVNKQLAAMATKRFRLYLRRILGEGLEMFVFDSPEAMERGARLNSRIIMGIELKQLRLDRPEVSYDLHFWNTEVPTRDQSEISVFSGDCSWNQFERNCDAAKPFLSNFLLIQNTFNTAIVVTSKAEQQRELTRQKARYDKKTLLQPEGDTSKLDIPDELPEPEIEELTEEEASMLQQAVESSASDTDDADDTEKTDDAESHNFGQFEIPREPNPKYRMLPYNGREWLSSPYRLEMPGMSVIAERMPRPSREGSTFPMIASDGPFYLMFAFITVMTQVVTEIVVEKEGGLKEVMRTYGLKTFTFWFSWFVFYALFANVFAVLSTVITTFCSLFGSHTSILVVYYLFYFYLFSLMTQGMVISCFADNQAGAAQMAFILNLGFYGLYWIVQKMPVVPLALKVVMSLSSTCCFNFLVHDLILLRPHKGVHLGNLFASENDCGLYLLMLLVDVFIYLFAAWYLDIVIPGATGTSRPWHFIFTDAYHAVVGKPTTKPQYSPVPASEDLDQLVERVPDGIAANRKAVEIQNLVKVFTTRQGSKAAVDNLNLEIYAGEIFCLLGELTDSNVHRAQRSRQNHHDQHHDRPAGSHVWRRCG